MTLFDLIVTAIALSMDAFAVSVGKGLSTPNARLKHGLICGAYFGGFQALMPLLGYLLASSFADHIKTYDHWIAFALLALIGANMIREAFSKEEETVDSSFSVKTMLLLAIATSIDALAVGISFGCLDVNLPLAVAIIGITTFILSVAGLKIGTIFGTRYKSKAEITGGVILILLGVKILLEHLEIITF